MLELLYDALQSEYGIEVETSSAERLRQKLYPLRKEHPELAQLSFILSPLEPQRKLWIVKARSITEEL